MRIKIFLKPRGSRIININGTYDVKTIANKYDRWEYIL